VVEASGSIFAEILAVDLVEGRESSWVELRRTVGQFSTELIETPSLSTSMLPLHVTWQNSDSRFAIGLFRLNKSSLASILYVADVGRVAGHLDSVPSNGLLLRSPRLAAVCFLL